MEPYKGRQTVTIDGAGWIWLGKDLDNVDKQRRLVGVTAEKVHRLQTTGKINENLLQTLGWQEDRVLVHNQSCPSLSPTSPSKEKLAETIKDRTVILGDDGWIRKMNDKGQWCLWGVSMKRIRELAGNDELCGCGACMMHEAERKEEAYVEETESDGGREGGGDPRDDGTGDQGPGEDSGGAPEAEEVQAAPAQEADSEEGLVDRGLTRSELAGKFNDLVDYLRFSKHWNVVDRVVELSGPVMTAVLKRDQALEEMQAELEESRTARLTRGDHTDGLLTLLDAANERAKAAERLLEERKEDQGDPVMMTYTEEMVDDGGDTKAEEAAFRGPVEQAGRSFVLGPPGKFEKISTCRMPIAGGEIRIGKIQGFDGFDQLGPPFFEVSINGLKLGVKRDIETFIQAASFVERWMKMERNKNGPERDRTEDSA